MHVFNRKTRDSFRKRETRIYTEWIYLKPMMRPLVFLLISAFLAAGTSNLRAQVVAAATGRQLSISAGGMVSGFQPDYAGGGIAETSPNRLYGFGAYVDVKFTRWFQVEGEARWLKLNQLANINQSNYLIGPRLPIQKLHFWRATPYAKVLIGLGDMNFEFNEATGRFTDIAYGGGLDVKLTRRISLRAIDFEYQQWPRWINNQQLFPYGASVGIGYKVF
jgi:Outer membrane protein beta-barrel domain